MLPVFVFENAVERYFRNGGAFFGCHDAIVQVQVCFQSTDEAEEVLPVRNSETVGRLVICSIGLYSLVYNAVSG